MRDFLVQSAIASVVLTLALNFLPRLFPNATRNAGRKVQERVEQAWNDQESNGSRVKVFFPWKAMLAISVVLTVLVNLAGYFAT